MTRSSASFDHIRALPAAPTVLGRAAPFSSLTPLVGREREMALAASLFGRDDAHPCNGRFHSGCFGHHG